MDLLQAWARTCAARGAVGDVTGAGVRLLAAYRSPQRVYHDAGHLHEVLAGVDELSAAAREPDLVRLAAWFHDAVYVTVPVAGQASSEQLSAAAAERELRGLSVAAEDRREVARLVLLTATHMPVEGDGNGAVLCDADLAVLARDQCGYAVYVEQVRREYAAVPEPDFRAGRAAVLRGLLAAPTLFTTELARARWEARARRNVSAELAALGG